MIDLTPLDVRKKQGDFQKALRGYDSQEVDSFLDLVVERMEELVRETASLGERCEALDKRVHSYDRRERAVQEALVTAQKLREDIQDQAQREAELARRESEAESESTRREADSAADAILRDAQLQLSEHHRSIEELERRRSLFFRSFRSFLAGELGALKAEEESISVSPDVPGASLNPSTPLDLPPISRGSTE